eukprot:PhF_6_TR35216/c0_g1_i1/m.51275
MSTKVSVDVAYILTLNTIRVLVLFVFLILPARLSPEWGTLSPPPHVLEAESNLRNADTFHWSALPMLCLVLHAVLEECAAKRYHNVLAVVCLLFDDWFVEVINSGLYRYTGYAPLWGTPRQSSFIILVGLNYEILLTFAMCALGICRLVPMPKEKDVGTLGYVWNGNMVISSLIMGSLGVAVECALNIGGHLPWSYRYWNLAFPFFIIWDYSQTVWAVQLIRGLPLATSIAMVVHMFFLNVVVSTLYYSLYA